MGLRQTWVQILHLNYLLLNLSEPKFLFLDHRMRIIGIILNLRRSLRGLNEMAHCKALSTEPVFWKHLCKGKRDKSGFMNVIHPWFGGQMDLCSNPYHPGTTCVALGKLLYFSEPQFICEMEGCCGLNSISSIKCLVQSICSMRDGHDSERGNSPPGLRKRLKEAGR